MTFASDHILPHLELHNVKAEFGIRKLCSIFCQAQEFQITTCRTLFLIKRCHSSTTSQIASKIPCKVVKMNGIVTAPLWELCPYDLKGLEMMNIQLPTLLCAFNGKPMQEKNCRSNKLVTMPHHSSCFSCSNATWTNLHR
jgi:hypothetical protein